MIPFEDTGAMETFLLDAVGKADPYDAQIISDYNQFVERQNILKNIPWEEYTSIQKSFEKLENLTE